MDKRQKLANKIQAGTVYLFNSLEDAVVMVTDYSPETGGKWFVKFPGEKEYEVPYDSNIATDAFIEATEITKDFYDNY